MQGRVRKERRQPGEKNSQLKSVKKENEIINVTVGGRANEISLLSQALVGKHKEVWSYLVVPYHHCTSLHQLPHLRSVLLTTLIKVTLLEVPTVTGRSCRGHVYIYSGMVQPSSLMYFRLYLQSNRNLLLSFYMGTVCLMSALTILSKS